ncbi:MAG TPA: hypothetical protein VGG92_00095 [Caulobacteraceae bacterium]
MIALRFTRGSSFYQIAPAYAGGEGYVGLQDGRVVARGADRVVVAKALLGSMPRPAGSARAT